MAQPAGGNIKTLHFKNTLGSLDSPVSDRCFSLYDWARLRTTQGALKLHLALDLDGYLPSFAVITTGNVHDVTVAKTVKLEPGTIRGTTAGTTTMSSWVARGVTGCMSSPARRTTPRAGW